MKRCPYETCMENLGEICICEENMQAEIDKLKGFIREAYFVGVFTDEPALEEKAEEFI